MFLKISEVAERLRISLSHAYALVRRGELVCYQLGAESCIRIRESDLEEFLSLKKREISKLARSKKRHF